MKIRIKGNSVRLRLTKTEVEIFCKTGRFEEQTQFPNGPFVYALQAKDTIEQMEAIFKENKIEIAISKHLITDWATNSKVGFQHIIPMANKKELSLLIEKDFVCMDEAVEDQSDNYPNPKVGA